MNAKIFKKKREIMEVYEFEKSFLDRMEEARNVLSWSDSVIPASQVRREWSCYVELQIEPIGWQALWKIPRVICEELSLRFPTVVFGYVDQVLFKELKAFFVVTAVQDDDVHLPERNEVSLIDLWATINQENDALNVEMTADCLDRLRFFYTHIWMPWDNESDDDRDWVEQHLDSRIKLACDLNGHKVPRALSAHIRTLLAEARYVQHRVEHLELDLSDDESDINKENSLVQVSLESDDNLKTSTYKDANQSLNKSHVTDLMRLHLRLAIIRSEIEILENPEMRQAYDDVKGDDETRYLLLRRATNEDNTHAKLCYLVMKPSVLKRQLELLNLAKHHVKDDCPVQLYPTLQDVLGVCQSTDDILLAPGKHTLKFLEYLNDNGSIKGLLDNRNDVINGRNPLEDTDKLVIMTSSDYDSILLVINGDFTLEHLVLDCRHVRTGILLKSGKLRMRNCRLIGDNRHSTQQGIFCGTNAQLFLESCKLESFATGVTMQTGASVEVENVIIKRCNTAMELLDEKTTLKFKGRNCELNDCKVGIYVDCLELAQTDTKALKLQRFNELMSFNKSNWTGECNFQNCDRNIYVLNKHQQLCSKDLLNHMLDDNEDKENLI